MVSARDSGSSGLRHCVVFLGKKRYSYSVSLIQVYHKRPKLTIRGIDQILMVYVLVSSQT